MGKKFTVASDDKRKGVRGEIVESRIIPFSDDHGVCIGGLFDGWIMWKHPDGQWVSVEKPEPEVPHSELTAVPAEDPELPFGGE